MVLGFEEDSGGGSSFEVAEGIAELPGSEPSGSDNPIIGRDDPGTDAFRIPFVENDGSGGPSVGGDGSNVSTDPTLVGSTTGREQATDPTAPSDRAPRQAVREAGQQVVEGISLADVMQGLLVAVLSAFVLSRLGVGN